MLLNFLRLDLCPSIWSIVENVQCVLKMKVYSVLVCFFLMGCGWQVSFSGQMVYDLITLRNDFMI